MLSMVAMLSLLPTTLSYFLYFAQMIANPISTDGDLVDMVVDTIGNIIDLLDDYVSSK